MPPMERSYTLGNPNAIRGNKNNMSLSSADGNYLLSQSSIVSKSIVTRLDLNIFRLCYFKASTIVTHVDDERGCKGGH